MRDYGLVFFKKNRTTRWNSESTITLKGCLHGKHTISGFYLYCKPTCEDDIVIKKFKATVEAVEFYKSEVQPIFGGRGPNFAQDKAG